MLILILIIVMPLLLCVIEMSTQRGVEKKPASDELKERLKRKSEDDRKDSE